MAKPKKYTKRIQVYLDELTVSKLKKRAEIMGLKPVVLARIIIDHSLSGEPIKQEGVSHVRQEEKQ